MGADVPSARQLLQSYLVTLAFRFRHVTQGAPEEFGNFDAGAGVRTPAAIVLHMTGLVNWVRDQFEPGAAVRMEALSFPEECERFHAAVRELDRVVAGDLDLVGDLDFGQIWRGPLTDAMTHVGQLATLRRLAGAPVERVRYWQVDMPGLGG